MGKQTKKSGSNFGGEWTLQKLHIIEEYLKIYATALKNLKVKKIYVDGFAGSGKTEIKTKVKEDTGIIPIEIEEIVDDNIVENKVIDGSALISLKYDFDEYYFLELDESRIAQLENEIRKEFPQKFSKVHFIAGDSNVRISEVISQISVYDRCVMFLDPYALELKWDTLEKISKCGVVDLWYLFPLSMIRLLEKQRDISDANKNKVTSILGTDEWLDKLFVESFQIDMFDSDDVHYNRVGYDKILEYVKERFSTIFEYVSPDAKVLKNEAKNAPMFMLCFMMTNKSPAAKKLAAKLVKSIINSTEKVYENI